MDNDFIAVAKCLEPTDAFVLRGCLVAAGVPAVVADANHVQANALLAAALGGVRVLVPAIYERRAQEVIAAFWRGDFALADDADVGEPLA